MKTLLHNDPVTVRPEGSPIETSTRFLSLEAFRGLAAVMIVLYHSRFYAENSYVSFVKNSAIFVDFFFILSGFVMAHSYIDKIGGSLSLKRFFLLRFGRLYPLHLFTLLLWVPYISVKVILYEGGTGDSDPSISNNAFTFLSNVFLVHALDGYQPLSWNFPSWSISAEFFTYLIFFLFVFIVSRTYRSQRHFIAAISIMPVCAYLSIWMLEGTGIELFLVQCVGGFFLGILLFLLYRRANRPALNPAAATGIEMAALLFVVLSVAHTQYGLAGGGAFYLSMLSFLFLIYVFVAQDTGYISRLLRLPPFQWLGVLSYSIYMTHAIVLAGIENVFVYVLRFNKSSFEGASDVIVFGGANLVNAALVIIVLAFSAITYRFVEVPWRTRFKKIAARY